MSAYEAQNRVQFSPDQPSSSTVSITVLSATPARAQKLFAFASVQIDIDGVQIGVHGIRAMHAGPEAAAIELPKYRDGDGVWRTAITLPDEIYTPIARAVLDELIERGLTARPAKDDRRLLRAGLKAG
jgi:stage V sporulation protein G